MKRFDEWQFPDNEEHLQKWMTDTGDRQHGRLCYQGHKYRGAIKHCKQRRVAVDVGAHIGLWSFMMAHDFRQTHAFEPMKEHALCWFKNTEGMPNEVIMHTVALGDRFGMAHLKTYTAGSSGDTRISDMIPAAEVPDDIGEDAACIGPLDDYNLQDVDFMKVDCEGYEELVLRGAEQTLLRCKPVIIVEQKRDHATLFGLKTLGAVEYLKSLGARHISDVGGDYILGWE